MLELTTNVERELVSVSRTGNLKPCTRSELGKIKYRLKWYRLGGYLGAKNEAMMDRGRVYRGMTNGGRQERS